MGLNPPFLAWPAETFDEIVMGGEGVDDRWNNYGSSGPLRGLLLDKTQLPRACFDVAVDLAVMAPLWIVTISSALRLN